jgi:hypothetical protein
MGTYGVSKRQLIFRWASIGVISVASISTFLITYSKHDDFRYKVEKTADELNSFTINITSGKYGKCRSIINEMNKSAELKTSYINKTTDSPLLVVSTINAMGQKDLILSAEIDINDCGSVVSEKDVERLEKAEEEYNRSLISEYPSVYRMSNTIRNALW